MPHLQELAEKYGDQGLVVVGVHTTGSGDKMAAFVAEQGITWPVAVDVDNKTTTAFAVDSYPDYYLIDRQGKLRVADLQNAAIEKAVVKLLAEPAPAGEEPDATKRLDAAIAAAKASRRNLLVHVHGPG